MPGRTKKTFRLADDIHAHYDINDDTGCWEWNKSKCFGYGQMRACDEKWAHRVFYKWAHGPIPEGHEVDHMCMNRKCVNPDHLRAVTVRVNRLENSGAPMARNAEKTHCSRGHEYSDGNTYINTNGWRRCKICTLENNRKSALRRKNTEAA